MDLMPTADWQAHKLLAGLGPEPLGNDFNETYLAQRLKGRATPIKSALLDQTVLSGLGNIYVCEVLHRANVAPNRLAKDLTPSETAQLVPLIRTVLTEAIEAGGSSLRDYRQTDGELGYFQHTFRVYDREGQPCTTCGTPIMRLVQSGRSSFYCPNSQR
jgi:formamidopyrimidine-DNA glycosylase